MRGEFGPLRLAELVDRPQEGISENGVAHDAVGVTNERKTGQSKAMLMKSRCQGMIT
jgi:hypothetical protein